MRFCLNPPKIDGTVIREPVFSLSIPAQADYLLIGADASVVGDSQTLPNGMGQICWLSKTWAIRRKVLTDVFAGSQRICALLKCVLLRHMGEFIGVQETRYLMNAMEKTTLNW